MKWNESVNNEWNEVNSTEEQERPQKCLSVTRCPSNKNKNKGALEP